MQSLRFCRKMAVVLPFWDGENCSVPTANNLRVIIQRIFNAIDELEFILHPISTVVAKRSRLNHRSLLEFDVHPFINLNSLYPEATKDKDIPKQEAYHFIKEQLWDLYHKQVAYNSGNRLIISVLFCC